MALIAGAVIGASAPGCSADRRTSEPAGSAGANPGSIPGSGGSSGAGDGLVVPDVAPPPGWHLWPYPPPDCAIFVPDDISTVEPLPWSPCPFLPDGCVEAGAPWAQEYDWGYGNLLSVAVVGGDTYLGVARAASKDLWWESLLLKNDVPIAAWLSSTVSLFSAASGPWIGPDGKVTLVAERTQAEPSPRVFIGSAGTIMDRPEVIERFDPPNHSAFPDGAALRSPSLLVLDEHYGRFTVRDLLTGSTDRPEPGQAYQSLTNPAPVGGSVYYGAWTGNLASVWARQAPSTDVPVLKDDVYSYDNFVTDGSDAAWLRGQDRIGPDRFQVVDLFTSPIGPYPQPLQPRKMLTLPTTGTPLLSVGSGWIAVRLGDEDVRLYRIRDGVERRLPQGVGRMWHGGQNKGLILVDGKLWVKSVPLGAAGNDIRFISRFDIDDLPAP